MLARQNRVRLTRDINRVYSRGRFGGGGGLSGDTKPDVGPQGGKVGFAYVTVEAKPFKH